MLKQGFIYCVTLLLLSGNVIAQEIEGINIPDTVILTNNKSLTLNGAGIRTKFFFNIYIGALYLEDKASGVEAVLNNAGAQRVSMYFLYDEVSKEKLVKGWNEGFENNNDAIQFDQLKSRLEKFNSFFSTSHKDDVVFLDYIPEVGTEVRINHELRGIISGRDFYVALLKVWLGEKPADDDLKEAMLRNL